MLTDLENWLIVEDTLPDIADYLLTGLTSWFEDPFETEPVIISTIPYIRQAACLQSQEIGWYAFLCGFIVEPLVTCQQTYYSSIHLAGDTPYSSVLENLTRRLDVQECNAP